MRIIDRHNTEKYTWGKNCSGFIFVESENLSMKLEIMPPATNEQLHFHAKSQQVFYVIKGEATFYISEKEFIVKENQAIHVLPNEKHFVVNNTSADLEFFVISAPSTKNDRTNIPAQ